MKPNQTQTPLRHRRLTALSCALLLGSTLTSGFAADRIWNGGGDQSSWTDANNWGGTAPVANDSLFFSGTTGLFPNNDFAAETDFAGITFNAGADSFTISGSEIDLAVNSGVTNNSVNEQTISANLDNNGANKVHNALAGNLVYSGLFRNNAVIKEGPFSLTLAGAVGNSSPGAIINNGALILAKSLGNALGSSITVHTNGILRTVGAGTHTDQIHFNTRVIMNGGVFQLQHVDSVNTVRLEEIASLSGSNLNSIVENGLADSTNRLDIGGGSGHRAIYNGSIRNGAGMFNLRVYRHNNIQVFNGTHTYTGPTEVNNTSGAGTTRMILNGTHTGGGDYTVNGHATTADRFGALGGSGSISASVANFNIRGILSPGGALSADLVDSATFAETTAILTFNNTVNLNDVTSTLDVQLNGTTAGSGHDQVVIAGSGSFSNNNANLKITVGYTPATGDKFTIVKVPGTDAANNVGVFTSLNGVPTDLSQGATFVDPGTGKNLRISYRAEGNSFDGGEGNGNDIMLEVVAPVGGASLTWRGNGTDNNWDVLSTANWFDGVNLVTFDNGDFVTFNNSGSNNIPVNLVGDLTPTTLEFNATKDYVLAGSGKLTGTVIITKTNTGTVSLVTDNDTVGSTLIQGGTLQFGTNGTSGSLSGTITVGANGVLAYNRSDDQVISTAAFSGTGGLVHKGDGILTIAAALPFTGKTTNLGGLLQFGDGTSLIGSVGGEVHVPAGKNVRYYYSGSQADIPHALSGAGTVDYESFTGSTIKILGGAVSSNYSGTMNVVSGTRLWTTDNNSGYALGNGSTVNVPDFSQVWLDRSATAYNQVFNIAGNGYIGDLPELGALRLFGCTLNGEINLLANARIGGTISSATIVAPIKGAFQLDLLGNADFQLSVGPTNGTHTYASTLVTRGWFRALNANAISAGPLTLDIAGGLRLNGNNLTVASLTDINSGLVTGDGAQVQNSHGSIAATLTVGTDNTGTTFNGVFGNGAGGALGLTKVGTGTLTMTAAHTNTGAVTVNGGTLALVGSGAFDTASRIIVGSGAFYDVSGATGTLALNSGQTLGGSGTVTGNVTTAPGSIIAPGTSVGTLTVAGNVTLGGEMNMELNRSLSPNSDRLVASGGAITGGGTLTVTNIGPALQVGDSFQLFTTGVSGITANLPTTDSLNAVTYTWQNNIAANGSVTVLSVESIAPPTLGVSQSGNTLTFTWTGTFKLQAQTNSLAIGLNNTWGDYPGGGTSPVNVTIDPADPTVFFRLSAQ
jgi:fibronectin-binding autotransporter adhesin